MSRTRRARAENSTDSRSGEENSLTSVAPGAEKRSVICVLMNELRLAASSRILASREPIRRAGSTKTGSSTSASRVIVQEMLSIATSASTTATMFVTTPERVSEKARCAPITSLLSRLTRAPVRVRVKKATGMVCTWSKTARRRSRINVSPIRADSQRTTSPTPASTTAIAAISRARRTTSSTAPLDVMTLTTRPASSGVAMARNAVTTLSSRNTASTRRCDRAMPQIRRTVAQENGRFSVWATIVRYRADQATPSMLMPQLPRQAPQAWFTVGASTDNAPRSPWLPRLTATSWSDPDAATALGRRVGP